MRQPKYKFGQPVIVSIETIDNKTKLKFKNKVTMFIRDILMDSTTEDIEYIYRLTTDLPSAYHYGESATISLNEKGIVLA